MFCHRHRGQLETCLILFLGLPVPSAVVLQDAPISLRYVAIFVQRICHQNSGYPVSFTQISYFLWALPPEQGADRKSWEHGSMMQLPTPGAHTERSPLRHSVLGDTKNKNDVPDTPSLTQKEDSKDTHHVSSLSDRVGTVPRRSERGAMERFDVIERLHHASQLHGLSGPPPEKPKNQTSSQYSTRHVSAVRV
jgi:hypothetical protein